ncbi:MAG: thiamine-phosphate kinase [Actinobacteria bacterium]|jgi:thiamine-monophosphate kinase|nr:thiamine-phosphate kinase [Actinomycetota bacterium]NCV81661.1 thiamine-phosphate kinase [Actinomycetota bacterium]NCX38031.1 thiamine-phosphate kinase [Actinomycetota bacterium]NCX39824.1 thiamine-phosphate kinase [Actinomycetota bacterium]NCX52632.1 thiamine-phosphate kinase [Actinomycetota bacterium]
MTLNEAQIIGALAEIFGTNHRGVQVGIGDDAAVVATGEHTVITTDMAVEGTHFDCQWSGAFQIGRKITAANLADIYAMGATPTYLVVALTLSGEESMEWISELAQGIKHEASSCGAVVVGGDLARGAIKVISMSALGEVEKVVTRSGAQVGDLIYLSSLPGWSGAGLSFIEKSELSDLENYAVEEFCSPTLDYSLAVAFANKGAHAMCDISDALVTQAAQLAYASDVQLVFDPEAFKASEEFSQLSELAEVSGRDVWQWIFAGGEDHVFLATGKDLPGLCVGVVKEGSGVLGLEMKKAPETWRHFS